MSRRLARWTAAALATSVGLLTAPALAPAGDIWVSFTSPRDGEPVIGEVVVAADVVSARPVRDVVFSIDGRPAGVVTAPPYRLRLDLGEANRSHTFEVVATDIDGTVARSQVITQPVPVGGEFEVELQQLYVTVTLDGDPVADLTGDDFEIRDDGRQQRLVTFAQGDIPFTAVLLIDASASMTGAKLEAARAGVTAFIDGMRELDQGKVVVFSDVIQNSTPFSGVREVLTAGLTGATGEGGTAINDLLYVAFKVLERRQGRRVVVLLSDGMDNHSALDMRNVLDRARRSQALLYWIRLERGGGGRPNTVSSAWRHPADYKEQFELLDTTVAESGGRIIEISSADQIQPTFLDILTELRSQYALGFYPDVRRSDGRWHRIEVKVARPAVDVRTHAGYLDL